MTGSVQQGTLAALGDNEKSKLYRSMKSVFHGSCGSSVSGSAKCDGGYMLRGSGTVLDETS